MKILHVIPHLGRGSGAARIVKDLADYGYSFYSLAAQGLTLIPITVDAILRRYAQILKSGDECFLNLLAVPSSVDLKALLSLRTS